MLLAALVEFHNKEKGIDMSVFYISNGEKMKFRHHKDIRMPYDASFTIAEEMSGCKEQWLGYTKPKSVRFRAETVELNADLRKFRVWYAAASAKDFFKVSIRLAEPYVNNLQEIVDGLVCAFLKLPRGLARGTYLEDIPGNITSKSVNGMEEYIPSPSRLTLELAELINDDEKEKVNKPKSFDYWVFDQEMLDKGVILTVGNENGVEFVRYHVIASLPESEEVVTAYVRPWFCEEYDV